MTEIKTDYRLAYEKSDKELTSTKKWNKVFLTALVVILLAFLSESAVVGAALKFAGKEMYFAANNKKDMAYAIEGKKQELKIQGTLDKELNTKVASLSASNKRELEDVYHKGLARMFIGEE